MSAEHIASEVMQRARGLRVLPHDDTSMYEGSLLKFTCDGREMSAHAGQTIAAALLAAGTRSLRVTSRREEPRGLFCGMGVCFDCLVQVDGRPNVRACRTPVVDGMRVATQQGKGFWEPVA